MRTLRDLGHTAYFAGGCVRDELLGLHPTDYDVATDATPDRVAGCFQRTNLVGASFGVVLVHEEGVTIEVATFRADGPYSDNRRPDRVLFSDPETDAHRRDFTINAVFLDPLEEPEPGAHTSFAPINGRVIDYVGGLTDLDNRVIRAVGDPDRRLAEDDLRALRAVRFAARFGFRIEPGTSDAIRRHASDLRGVSRERVGDEIRRMLAGPTRALACSLLQQHGLDAPVLDEPTRDAPLKRLAAFEADPVQPSAMTALAAWALDRDPEQAISDTQIKGLIGRYRAALCLSNDECSWLSGVLGDHSSYRGSWQTLGVAAQKRLASRRTRRDALRLVRGDLPLLAERIESDIKGLEDDGIGLAPAPLVTGDDLVAAGCRPGPGFGAALDAAYDAQLEGRVRDRESALELARRSIVQ